MTKTKRKKYAAHSQASRSFGGRLGKMPKLAGLFAAACAINGLSMSAVSAQEAQVIKLTQVACQFVESEGGVDHGYAATDKAGCETINSQSAHDRVKNNTALNLKPGKYIFRVTNQDVDYDLGFYLRGAGIVNRTLLPSVSGGGLSTGVTKDYVVELKEGEYVYSCPLNSTPDYKLNVTS